MSSLVFMKNNQPVRSSLETAENFKRNHRDVLKEIDDLKEEGCEKLRRPLLGGFLHLPTKQTTLSYGLHEQRWLHVTCERLYREEGIEFLNSSISKPLIK